MAHHIFLIAKFIILFLVLSFSFTLLALRKLALFLDRNYRMITWVDPVGARQVIQGLIGVITWIVGKIRSYLAQYINSYHPRAWRRWRDYLISRR